MEMARKAAGPVRATTRVAPAFFSKVVVISGSSVLRELLRLILTPHSENVLLAGDRKHALEQMQAHNPVDVVICDVDLPGTNGFELLDDAATFAGARPEVILIANEAVESDARRAAQRGAAAYLVKPISFRQITGALRQRTSRLEQRAPRRRPGGRVSVIGIENDIGTADAVVPQLLWYARDLSMTGAFLETESPLPIGCKLDLAIEIGNMRVRVMAEVVRIQDPAWGCVGGIGVRFFEWGDCAKEALYAYVSSGGADTY